MRFKDAMHSRGKYHPGDQLLVGGYIRGVVSSLLSPLLDMRGSCGEDRCFHILVGPGLGPGWFSGRDIFC